MNGCRTFSGRFGLRRAPRGRALRVLLRRPCGGRAAQRAPQTRPAPGGVPCCLPWLRVQDSKGGMSRRFAPALAACPGWSQARLPPRIPWPSRGIGPGHALRQAKGGNGQGVSCAPLSSPGGPRTPGPVGSLSHFFKIRDGSALDFLCSAVLWSLTDGQAGCILASSEWAYDTIHGIHAGREPRARMDISGGRRPISPAFYIARCPRCARGQHPGDALGRCRAGVVSRCN